MEFAGLKAQSARLRPAIERRLAAVLDHGRYIMGPEVPELEEKLARLVGVRHCLSCSSGTDALLLALMAHDVGPGDAVFTTPFTFAATAEAVALLGATPVFVDIDPETYNLDPVQLDKALAGFAGEGKPPGGGAGGAGRAGGAPRRTGGENPGPGAGRDRGAVSAGRDAKGPDRPGSRQSPLRPRAVLAVDLFGLPADYDGIRRVAGRHGLLVVEDGAQSLGASYRGRMALSLGDIAAASFFPSKPLGGYGDGGAVFTDDDAAAGKIRSLRAHGQGRHKYDHVRVGMNARLDTLQAAVLLAKLEAFAGELALRRRAADWYARHLGDKVEVPAVPPGLESAWAQYTVRTPRRKALCAALEAAGIPHAIHYPKPLHLQPAFGHLGYAEGDFPMAEAAADRALSLPMHPYLTEDELLRVSAALGA